MRKVRWIWLLLAVLGSSEISASDALSQSEDAIKRLAQILSPSRVRNQIAINWTRLPPTYESTVKIIVEPVLRNILEGVKQRTGGWKKIEPSVWVTVEVGKVEESGYFRWASVFVPATFFFQLETDDEKSEVARIDFNLKLVRRNKTWTIDGQNVLIGLFIKILEDRFGEFVGQASAPEKLALRQRAIEACIEELSAIVAQMSKAAGGG